ncbi:origin recognition complex subunit 2 [Phymastichus coffea]|uniref:origin recognition complex subunit 2 n=1 Tax=Phymastichus coffea TaxID=108790 RepID=UPI00273B3A0D|nr:origin recognition complex subunit 2 [Phymastichus coffea]
MSKECRKSARIQQQVQCLEIAAATKKVKKNEKPSPNCFDFINNDFQKELNQIEASNERATELFDDHDIEGNKIYRMQGTPVKKNAMIEKAKQYRDSLQIISVHNQLSKNLENTDEKKQQKHVSNLSNETDSDEELYSGSNKNHKNNRSKVISKNEKAKQCKQTLQIEESVMPVGRMTRSKAREYLMEPDDYFASQSVKSLTSNNTLSRLKNKQLDETTLQELLLSTNYIPKKHQEAFKEMKNNFEKKYIEWLHTMEEGFTVLLHGVGSKRTLINNFYKKMIPDEPTLIINGFFPSLTIKDILDNIMTELLGLEQVPNQNECFEIIEKIMKTYPDDRMYLLIHNLDGGMLRTNKAQDVLSRLANIPNIHMLASVDHINAPLIWDNVKRARYNFYWVDATTFLPYEAETSYESSLLVQKSGALALLSLQNVFASLTSNAKSIYKLLVEYQLKNGGTNYTGMSFKDLYKESREHFLVSSDQALRAQLTEFIDHKLVKNKRNFEGVESLIIPLDNALLKQFLEQQNEMF